MSISKPGRIDLIQRLILIGCAMGVGLGLGWTSSIPIARAQYSPNCLRNNQKDYCAITPIAGATTEKQAFDMITFADHTVYEVLRNETSCRNISAQVRTCNAKIINPPGNPKPIHAFYRGTSYEGGYKHEYIGKGIRLTYFFLD